jgi:hypothetical protein
MPTAPESKPASGESVRITMDSVNDKGEQISSLIAEWHGMTNEEANVFSMTVASAVFEVVDGFREAKAAQGGGPVTSLPNKFDDDGRMPPGQMR